MSVRLTEAAVRACFDQPNQADVLVALYKLVFPDFDAIDQFDGWPVINDATWKAICRMFMEFDKIHHPEVLAGGLWLNCGFAGHGKLRDWEVSIQDVRVHSKQAVA
jgi:hypothetical protein